MTRESHIAPHRRQHAILKWALAVAVCLFCLDGAAFARCGLPDEVMALVDDLYAASRAGASADDQTVNRIRRDLRGIDMRDVSSKLFSVGLAHRRSRIEALLEAAQRVDASGGALSPNLLRERLKSVERLDDAVCKLEEIAADEMAKARAVSQTSDPSRTFENLGTLMRMTILLGAVGVVSGLLVAGRLVYRWGYALLSVRRICRICAALEEGLDVVDGTITVLGRKGCSFQPVNSGAYERAATMMDKAGVFLVVDGRRYLMTSGLARGYFVSMFFQRPLRRCEQDSLLKLSSITPREAPRLPKAKAQVRAQVKAQAKQAYPRRSRSAPGLAATKR